MKIKEQVIKEIESLSPNDLLVVLDIIKSYTFSVSKSKSNNKTAYIEVQKLLNQCSGSLSDDIISSREDRV